MKTWYTYHILDPENNVVFYIGKGYGRRMYIHMTRALKWRETGKIIPGGNKHLYNKLLKIYDKGLLPLYNMVFESKIEKEALIREELDIKNFGLENLCNLTQGGGGGEGEGETRSKESLEKLSKSLKEFWSSNDGYSLRAKYSHDRLGCGNPMYGAIENPEHVKNRMKACLSVPRWNKGLKGDLRCKGPKIGNMPHNIKKCKAINLLNNIEIIEISISNLSKSTKIPIITLQRMLNNTNYKSKKWDLIWKVCYL